VKDSHKKKFNQQAGERWDDQERKRNTVSASKAEGNGEE
jgi:hypothetical protein